MATAANTGIHAPKRPLKRIVVGWSVTGLAAIAVVLGLIAPQYRRPARPAAFAEPAAFLAAPPAAAGRAADPRVIRSAAISLTTARFDDAKAAIEAMMQRRAGQIGSVGTARPVASGRTLGATLRVPAEQLDGALAELRSLGRVDSESQRGAEVTGQMIDLQARLKNARVAEQRLTDILKTRAGNIRDVLEVEKEMTRVRGDIEQMEAEHNGLAGRVAYATIEAMVREELPQDARNGRLAGAAFDGWRNLVESVSGAAALILAYGPSVLLWAGVLFLPAHFGWKRWRAMRYPG